ncbi:MAG: phosphotransferase family protein [Micromonosporaceae bacterium]
MPPHVKRRGVPQPGSIPEALDMFRAEVRFYREIAPVVGVRVPVCYHAEADDRGTLLELEDLAAWRSGAEPVAAARGLTGLHRRWEGQALQRWPWLRRMGAAAELVGQVFDDVWSAMAGRADITPATRAVGDRLAGHVVQAERAVARVGPVTLLHGDASLRNLRTSPSGEVAFLDWEDVSAGPGARDLAWLLVSSVEPERWQEAIAAYGDRPDLTAILPALLVQGLLSMSGTAEESAEAIAWSRRLDAAAHLVGETPV